MKLEKIEGHENYVCTVVKLPAKQPVQGLDKLVKVTVFGNDVLTQKDAAEDILYLFFPAECEIASGYLWSNNEYRDSELNQDKTKKGYFEQSGRVKTIKFKGVISTGYLAPISTLADNITDEWSKLKVGDEFNIIDGVPVCKKYKPVHQHATAGNQKESRFNKKLKRFSKLVANQFRFHVSTSHLAKNLHVFQPEDIIVITDKWHGTSGVFSNVLVKREYSWSEKILIKLLTLIPGITVNNYEYGNLYSSRTVIKNQYINPDQQGGYYGEDIWAIVNKELEGKIEQGITLYGEIVGYLPSGKMIQKGYDYGCTSNGDQSGLDFYQHKFLVYRITYTKPDGNVIEFSWQQIKDYCKKHSIETVKELYFGKVKNINTFDIRTSETYSGKPYNLESSVVYKDLEHFREGLFDDLTRIYLEEDCKHCINKVPAEGIVVRIDGRDSFSAFKLKAKRFLEHETKQLDTGEVNIEDEQSADINYEEQL